VKGKCRGRDGEVKGIRVYGIPDIERETNWVTYQLYRLDLMLWPRFNGWGDETILCGS
jgi:hypothetical protein